MGWYEILRGFEVKVIQSVSYLRTSDFSKGGMKVWDGMKVRCLIGSTYESMGWYEILRGSLSYPVKPIFKVELAYQSLNLSIFVWHFPLWTHSISNHNVGDHYSLLMVVS